MGRVVRKQWSAAAVGAVADRGCACALAVGPHKGQFLWGTWLGREREQEEVQAAPIMKSLNRVC